MIEHRSLTLQTPHGPLHGDLRLSPAAQGIVLIAHGSSGLSHPADAPAIDFIREQILAAGLGCMTLALVTMREEHFADALGNVSLLAQRLSQGLEALSLEIDPARQRIGVLAWGPITPVALRATATHDSEVSALVCLGGLLDLAGLQYLRSLSTPLLFIQPSHDTPSQHSNQRAWPYLSCPKEISPEAATAEILHNPTALASAVQKAISHFICLLL